MILYITSTGRVDRQLTWGRLPKVYQKQTFVVVYPHEEKKYNRAGFPTLVYPGKPGLSNKRQWIAETHYKTYHYPYFCLLDDDLDFQKRRLDEPRKARVATPEQVGLMLDMVEGRLCNGYAHAGVLLRNMGAVPQFTDKAFAYDMRMLDLLAYNAEILHWEKIRFDRIPVMSDFDVTLQLLRRGYSNALYCKYLVGQPSKHSGFSGIGGCSTYRTPEMQAAAAHELARLHPGLVKVVEKKTKMSWGGGVRTDVRISWKKAFAEVRNHAC